MIKRKTTAFVFGALMCSALFTGDAGAVTPKDIFEGIRTTLTKKFQHSPKKQKLDKLCIRHTTASMQVSPPTDLRMNGQLIAAVPLPNSLASAEERSSPTAIAPITSVANASGQSGSGAHRWVYESNDPTPIVVPSASLASTETPAPPSPKKSSLTRIFIAANQGFLVDKNGVSC